MRIPLTLVLTMLVASWACPQATSAVGVDSATTSGLTWVMSVLNANQFTWTVTNGTGPGDGQPGWDVLIWDMAPIGVSAPIYTESPAGWEWVSTGNQGKFQIKDDGDKYKIGTAVVPGGSLSFGYAVDPAAADIPVPTFLVHVGAVLPAPNWIGGYLVWSAAAVNGNNSWFDQARTMVVTRVAPEPTGVLAVLVWCAGLVAVLKRCKSKPI